MLDGFLTTALELIIILDVCGAIIYVVAVSLRRAKQKQAEQADAVPTTPGLAYGPTLSTKPSAATTRRPMSGPRAMQEPFPALSSTSRSEPNRHSPKPIPPFRFPMVRNPDSGAGCAD